MFWLALDSTDCSTAPASLKLSIKIYLRWVSNNKILNAICPWDDSFAFFSPLYRFFTSITATPSEWTWIMPMNGTVYATLFHSKRSNVHWPIFKWTKGANVTSSITYIKTLWMGRWQQLCCKYSIQWFDCSHLTLQFAWIHRFAYTLFYWQSTCDPFRFFIRSKGTNGFVVRLKDTKGYDIAEHLYASGLTTKSI